jgi:hypothetical protein
MAWDSTREHYFGAVARLVTRSPCGSRDGLDVVGWVGEVALASSRWIHVDEVRRLGTPLLFHPEVAGRSTEAESRLLAPCS